MKCKYCGVEHPAKEKNNPFFCMDQMTVAIEQKYAEIAALNGRVHDLENALIMSNSLLEAISDLTEGNEPSDFMMSFGIVRETWDKITALTQWVKELEIRLATTTRLQSKYPNGANGCCCLFDDDENQIEWCKPHAKLRDRVKELDAENYDLAYYRACTENLESAREKRIKEFEAANAKYKSALEMIASTGGNIRVTYDMSWYITFAREALKED